MRAYKFADADGNGFITPDEFRLLLRSLVYFNEVGERMCVCVCVCTRGLVFARYVRKDSSVTATVTVTPRNINKAMGEVRPDRCRQ